MNLLAARLKNLKIINDENLDIMISRDMCCEPVTEDCMLRKCKSCANNLIVCDEFDGEEDTYYDAWQLKVEEGRNKKESYRKTVKGRNYCKVYELVNLFFLELPKYMMHLHYIRHQYREIDKIKKNLSNEDVLIHVDFSENYNCKFHREIQACHFGGN
jgi:hypothetical protein